MGCGIETEANTLLPVLVAGEDFTLPQVDFDQDIYKLPAGLSDTLYAKITKLDVTALTEGTITGDGAFDKIMAALKAHLRAEYDAQRITGAEYTKAYIAMVETALGNATQFLLQKDQAFWAAQLAQVQAITAVVTLETAKMQYALSKFQALGAKADYALSKIKLATESMSYCINKYTLENNLPKQLELMDKQIETADKQNELLDQQIEVQHAQVSDTLTDGVTAVGGILGKQQDLIDQQILTAEAEVDLTKEKVETQRGQTLGTRSDGSTIDGLIGKQLETADAQIDLIDEQREAQRAQTMDTRTDGVTPVEGVLGKQKALYTQQITSYQRDAEVKAAKPFVDAWITQKTIDEGLVAPTGFTNAEIQKVLARLMTENNFT